MVRLGLAGSLTAFLLASAAPAYAAAGDDTVAEVMRDCGGNSLPRDLVSSCLERARVLDQSDPSAQLESLEAKLEQQVRRSPSDVASPLPPPNDQMGDDDRGPPQQGYGPDNGQPDDEMGPDDQGPPDQGYGPDDRGPPDAAPSDGDEPPIDDGEDGYDNSQPDNSYDQPDAPDDDMGPPPPDDDDQG